MKKYRSKEIVLAEKWNGKEYGHFIFRRIKNRTNSDICEFCDKDNKIHGVLYPVKSNFEIICPDSYIIYDSNKHPLFSVDEKTFKNKYELIGEKNK